MYYSNTPQVVRLHARAGKQYVIYPIIEREYRDTFMENLSLGAKVYWKPAVK